MALPLTGITVTMVAGATGNFTNKTVGGLCSYSGVNKWSKYKPVSYASVSPSTDAQFKETN